MRHAAGRTNTVAMYDGRVQYEAGHLELDGSPSSNSRPQMLRYHDGEIPLIILRSAVVMAGFQTPG